MPERFPARKMNENSNYLLLSDVVRINKSSYCKGSTVNQQMFIESLFCDILSTEETAVNKILENPHLHPAHILVKGDRQKANT